MEFETLDAKVSRALMNTSSEAFRRKRPFAEESEEKEGKSLLTGRQIAEALELKTS